LGYLLAAAALLVIAAAIWAARYYSHARVYARQIRAERRRRTALKSGDAVSAGEDPERS
jgi:hypothetical protein